MRNTVILVVALFALLGVSLYFAYDVWASIETGDVPPVIWAALAGGVFFSLLIGGGLMALVFYSNRKGYDDRASHFGSE